VKRLWGKPSIKQLQMARDVDALAQALRSDAWWIRNDAAHALAALDDARGVQFFLANLTHPMAPARAHAATILGDLDDPQAVAPLIAARSDAEFEVRQAATRALRRLRQAGIEMPLDEADLQHDEPLPPVAAVTIPGYSCMQLLGRCIVIGGGLFLLIGPIIFPVILNHMPDVRLDTFLRDMVSRGIVTGVPLGLGIGLAILGVSMVNRARRRALMQMQRVRARTAPTADSSPLVLYLRSFRDDRITAQPADFNNYLMAVLNPGVFVLTEEEQLADALEDVGRFVAIGEPGEALPALGAERLYVGADAWQQTVMHMMAQSRLIVLRTGLSKGLWWEVQRAVELVPPQHILFVVSYVGVEYEVFRTQAQHYLPCQLPEQPFRQKAGLRAAIITDRLAGFIAFDVDWTAQYLPLVKLPRDSKDETVPGFELAQAIRTTLQPVFERLELDKEV